VIEGIVLAAGFGRRMGMPKALLTLEGVTFHALALRAFAEARVPVITVINPQIESALDSPKPGERRVVNEDPDQPAGMLSSIRLGVRTAMQSGATGVILLPVDHPLVMGADIRSVSKGLDDGAEIVVATYGGRRGHPIGLGSRLMRQVLDDPSITALRDLVHRERAQGGLVEAAASEGVLMGVNTEEDLRRASNRSFR
jgi:CTP:molybdopterin cytidylyltransferase MocA